MNTRSIFAALALFAACAWAEGLPDLGESAQADLSPQMERKLGEQIMRDIRLRDPAYLDDPEILAYLDDLGGKLVSASPEPGQGFQFFAMRDASLNAFAMPGGFIGVHTGLVLAAQSESELAGVLGHEIAHVTQRHIARMVGKQSQASILSIAAMVVGVLAARSNSQIAEAAIVGGQAAGVQSQLNYSRDFEREADRIGIQTLEQAGYDVRGMATFFERLQKFSRLYENNAPAYLRTHPLTTERIADMESRATQRPYKQVPDSAAFHLVRAKLRAENGTPREAVTDFETQVKERRYAHETAARYGLARAKLRAADTAGAATALAALRKTGTASPMVETLAAEIAVAQNDREAALRILRDARARYPTARALTYAYVDTLLAAGKAQAALDVTSAEVQTYAHDARLWSLRAKSYAALGKRLAQHRAQAEVYVLQGQLAAAIDQLQLAQKAGDGDFYEQSQVDARLRELRRLQAEEAKDTRGRS